MRARVAGTEAPGSEHLDMVSLAERMGRMLALREIVALTIVIMSIVGPRLEPGRRGEILAASAGYALISLLFSMIGSMSGRRRLWAVAAALLVDGVYLAWAVHLTGGLESPLRFLFYLHLVAVTLLASYRTGLKVALWHSLLLLVTFHAAGAGLIATTPLSAMGAKPTSLWFMITSLWLVAIGTALFSSLNERELRRGKSELGMLADMARELETTRNPESVAEIFLARVMQTFGLVRGVLLAVRGQDTEVIAARGTQAGPEQGPPDGVLRQAWRERKTLLVKKFDDKGDSTLSKLLPDSENLVVVPLFGEGEALGALVVEHPKRFGARIERRRVAMLDQFGAHASLALRNAWLVQEVEALAAMDPLTSVANRRTLQTILETEIARARREGGCLAFVMLDVDNFKAFNDTHGHQAGDDLLRNLGRGLSDACRVYDTVARYGGEEFAVVMPGGSTRDAEALAERSRRVASAIESAAPVTASAGVAVFPEHGDDLESLMKAADEALYRSKRSGRNRTTLAASPRSLRI